MKCIVLFSVAVALIFSSTVASEWETFVNSNNVTVVWADSMNLCWGSTAGVVIYDPSSGASYKIVKSVGGLKSNEITAIAKDADARLWIGAAGEGISVLDNDTGWEFHSTQNLHLLADDILDIATSLNRTVVATAGGMSVFEDGRFRRFFNGSDWASFGCDSVLSVSVDDVQALAGTPCGLFTYRFADGTWETLLSGHRVHSMDHDGKNLFWIVASDSIYTYDGSEIEVIPKRYIKPDIIRDIGVADSAVWVATNNGPSRYDFSSQSWIRDREGLTKDNWDAPSISVVDDGTVWIATREGAAVLVDTVWVIHASEGPAGNYVEDIEIDANGNVWCATGTRGGVVGDVDIGILRFDGFRWEQIKVPTLPSNNPYALDSNPIDGSMWIGFWGGGLVKYDVFADEWTSYTNMLRSPVVSEVYVDERGRVVVGEYLFSGWGGLGVLCDGDKMIHYSRDDDNACITTTCVTAIGPGPGGSYFIGSHIAADGPGCDANVFELDLGGECMDKSDDFCLTWGAIEGWAQGFAYDLALDPYGTVWFGTSGGLSCYDGTWHVVSKQLGTVWDIEVDRFGTKWAGCEQGLIALKGFGVEWSDFANVVDVYNSANSPLAPSPIKAIEIDADGALWIGTAGGGIYRFYPPRPQVKKTMWVDVFPNPYVESRHSEIRFSGFLPGSKIRIYTVAGDLVEELDAQSSWARENMEQREITSGVYIFHAYAEDGSEFVGRLAIIR